MPSKRQIMVGGVPVGGGAPVAIQSMTKTETADFDATMCQIRAIADAGGDIVRGASLVVWGVRDGRDAAEGIHAYLEARTPALALAS